VTGKKITRRQAIRTLGGATLFGAGVVGGALSAQGAGAEPATEHDHVEHYDEEGRRLSRELPAGAAAGPYGGEHSPPTG
jgi:hypothetical protein